MKIKSRKTSNRVSDQAGEGITVQASSVPVTPASHELGLAPDPFWIIEAPSLERAKLLKSRVAIEKAVLFQNLVVERTLVGDLDLPSLFEATFNDQTGAAFWNLRLGGMIGPEQFVTLLVAFLTAEGGIRSTHELALRATLTRDLLDAGVIPIATEVEHRGVITHVDPETGNQHFSEAASTFHLDGNWFDPVPVVKWMAEREIYHRFLPSSLRVYCGIEGCPMPSTQREFDLRKNKAPRQRGPRPDTSRRIEQEMRDAIHRGVDLGSMKTAEMSATFKAAASTCTVARDRVLSELGSQKNSE